ncbi:MULTISPECIES: F0F1 ATP synthase subunit C [Pseudohongiella]|jgi:F-type H+-transporting ATPase subunit c|uniref:ATP synthase subunit c n=2 Tax=root TaxID=1 RepID=A0A1E8CLE0_9GAMM|nr:MULTISPECIES: F0F1 ATP synthase subunit C [Pseudohongiella]MDO9475356.1 F0F1 ATP synthase subunit C [Pseudohongiella sp.]MDP2284379.1 F0F1 ATP synthase subunit C [Pseudohongiella sp.]MDP2380095.1 F0F1 ATP synthase subunit C [Pseudohongiella sp.]MDP3516165.1 F0F1 ATP synthase subunit C [Pseudohongiella sp.]OFE13270.1 F0F1 ATP synthase subunit C [Pseudohongiella acticola]|tara:strand:+ start:224 stop:469 length:246 start_codon:yes stop_codon:yes gene_type:complete
METIQAFSVIAIALIFGLCGAGTAVAFGNLGGKLIESSARQPELAPKLQVQFFLVAGFVDVISIIGVGVSFLVIFANPFLG